MISSSSLARADLLPINRAILVQAAITRDPPAITLTWKPDDKSNRYGVFRRDFGTADWGNPHEIIFPATTYTDKDILPQKRYEYRIQKIGSDAGAAFDGLSYLLAGIDLPVDDLHGSIILLTESATAEQIPEAVNLLASDLTADGWHVIRQTAKSTDSPTNVKKAVKAACTADPSIKALLLFGHVPVPYSGDLLADGHPDHQGAYPADGYYADLTTDWTDTTVTGGRNRQANVPGDGKFDPSNYPGPLDLMVGRIDLHDMPAFVPTENELLANYALKAHRYRNNQMPAAPRVIITDGFHDFNGNAPAANAWRMAPLVGITNLREGEWFPSLKTDAALFAFGCGPGGADHTSATGIGFTRDFALNDCRAVFTFLFGSYFGDWDFPNDLLRAPLAMKDYGLTCAWVGYPNYFFHPMALGAPIGQCILLSQNNGPRNYDPAGANSRGVHMALMGDPTLRMHVTPPPANLTATPDPNGLQLTWQSSPGVSSVNPNNSTPSPTTWPSLTATSSADKPTYRIYRATLNPDGSLPPFTFLGSTISTFYLDPTPPKSAALYMVRSILLQQSPSGTYDNPSQGIMVRAAAFPGGVPSPASTSPATPFKITPTTANSHIQLTWPHLPAALGYRITRSSPNAPDQTLVPLLPLNTFIDITSAPGQHYTYHITPILPDTAAPTSTLTTP